MATTTTSFISFLGLKGSSESETTKISGPTSTTKTPVRALPSPWYTSQNFYELERRAIFSKKWLFLTNRSRFQEPGDFHRFNIAGYDIILALDRTNTINAFHNICRHRAYPVIEEATSGRAKIFSCRYHGWSYGLNGKLAKAPNYQNFTDTNSFDKSATSLFPIHTHIDANDFIWINLSASPTPEPWSSSFDTVDNQSRFSRFNFKDYILDHTYEMVGNYNWKLLADNFNECYHCKTTHADVPTFLTIDAHDVHTEGGHMQHDHAPTEEQRAKGFDVNSTYYFPNASMSVSPHFLMIQRFHPHSPTKSTMSYEIYRNKTSSEEDFKLISEIYARVMAEDKVLCEGQQRNLDRGVFVNGQLHPRWEKGPLFFQKGVREAVEGHWGLEKEMGKEIWPARQQGVESGDEEMCSGLSCGEGGKGLEW